MADATRIAASLSNGLAALALGVACLFLSGTRAPAADVGGPTAAPAAMESVRISEDGRGFVLSRSGTAFVPWGFNYLGEFGKLVEETWHEDWPRLERDFREMRKLGANVVRIHLQFGTYMTAPDEFDPAQLGRLKRLLDLARETGLYVDVTGLSCYRLGSIPAWYDALDEAERWDVQARWWQMIARTCAGHPAVFCYDLMNEPVVGGQPKDGEPRWVGGELGGLWFVQRISQPASGRTGRNNVEIAEAWAAKLTTAIRREDPRTPITVGVIPWAHVWPNAKPLFYAPEAAKHFDFVSIHLYPGQGKVEQAIAALSAYDIGKPLVVEETFPLACTIEELDQFIDGSRDRVDGWISHYFGHTIDEHRNGAEPAGAVADFLEYWSEKGETIMGASVDGSSR